ncbi:hypothetical protein G647_09485 [Cladophialophora carrionii CBS 160.54]|uniref:DUF7923 domain-containing protein n=1 Tax=Cladophialophora carrionii CBS 160.54 TaxID=1279043 RepID=V9DKA3_9EURO|nr:uncharacterized protein G647_09485 [Cladophialophora carrionii CBS 160.54]ETI27295.1 hypothetical protein G647_09485 [Cladophialophora carrionii CBS 160.54]
MSLISWISSFPGKANPGKSTSMKGQGIPAGQGQTPVEHIDFSTLAHRVEELRYELDRARDICEQANLELDKYRTEIHRLKCTLDAERDACSEAYKLLMREKDRNKELQNRNRNLQNSLKGETTASNSQLQARLNTETASLKAMTKHARILEEKLVDTQLDLEYLKCTTSVDHPSTPTVALNNHAPLPAQPFVVVLVDGDAYNWASDISHNDCPSGTVSASNNFDGSGPGAMAATRVRNEVTKFILNQNGTIPVTAKIITRVFCNFSSRPGLMTSFRNSGPAGLGLAEFAVQFTEKLPLFDFFDAGRGKERADDKIRENFHLFLSTPNCHAIFVAACLDNGFARMLEQYSDHPLARQKIVLVSPGYVALEIQRLCLKEIEWPSVFAKRMPPPDVAVKHEREKAKAQKQRASTQRSVSTPVVSSGTSTSNVHPKLLDMVPTWNVNAAMLRASGGVGFRVALDRAALETLEEVETIEGPEDID